MSKHSCYTKYAYKKVKRWLKIQEKFRAEIEVILIAACILTKVWEKKRANFFNAPQRPAVFPKRQKTVSLRCTYLQCECMFL